MQQREDGRRRWRPRAVPTSAQAPVAPPRCGAVWRLAELCDAPVPCAVVAVDSYAFAAPFVPAVLLKRARKGY
uniref:Uncharacterized protein n=1 Tax=Oryza barthii TaxID=65489 RepID=A0A0D3ETK5_9ORYZ